MSQSIITEDDLHAYVDATLSTARRAEVEEFLATHPEDSERVAAYQVQNESLKALFNPVLDEPLPEGLKNLAFDAPDAKLRLEHGTLSRWSMQRFAASVAIAMIGALGGWLAHSQLQPADSIAQMTPLPRQAAIAHAVFSPDVRRPVEVSAEHEDQLVAWLSKRLGTAVRPPKLGVLGYELIGGRLLPGNVGPVAQFMYHDASGQRLTLYVSTENTRNQETAFRFVQEGPVNVFYWIDGKFGYALSGGIDKGELARVATAVYDQIERK